MWIEHVLLETNKIVTSNSDSHDLYQKKLLGLYYASSLYEMDTINTGVFRLNDPQQLTSIYDLCTNILSRLST